MDPLTGINLALAGLNALLALGLGVVYSLNYRRIRSPFTLALVIFGVFLLFHNGILLWHYISMMGAFSALGEELLLAEGVLQAIALSALLWATWR